MKVKTRAMFGAAEVQSKYLDAQQCMQLVRAQHCNGTRRSVYKADTGALLDYQLPPMYAKYSYAVTDGDHADIVALLGLRR